MDLWERQPREKGDAYNAFLCFCDLGKERSPETVAAQIGRSVKTVNRWCKRHDWQARADNYDTHKAQEAQRKRLEELTAMLERQVKIGKHLQIDAMESIRQRGLNKASFHSLAEILKIGMEMERTARQGVIEAAKEKEDNNLTINIVAAKR